MARKARKGPLRNMAVSDLTGMMTLGPNGEVPGSKVPTASQAWTIADQLKRDDAARSERRSRVYKQYKRFPPTSYSKICEKGAAWQSNVCWGQLKFIVDSQKSAFYDLVSESPELVEITTTFGTPEERIERTLGISLAFDTILRLWPDYLVNAEQDIDETMLYGKGIQMWESQHGWQSTHTFVNNFLVPNEARFDFRNVETIAIERSYSPNELYRIIKHEKESENLGWNPQAVIDGLRYNLSAQDHHKNREDWLKDIAEGSFFLSRHLNERIDTYQVYVREFDDTITKLIILRDYVPTMKRFRKSYNVSSSIEDNDLIDKKIGFLFAKQKYMKSWSDLFCPVTDCVGSGLWHEIQSQAEQAYVGARQYDITMNRIVDAIFINMMCMLTGGNPDANKRIREMDFLPFFVLPDGVEINQNQLKIPTTEAIQTLTFQMRDLYSGMAVYKTNQATQGGRQRTKGEAELDWAEQSKVTGTQLSRFNNGRSLYLSKLYEKFIKSSKRDDKLRTLFDDMLEEMKIPLEAAEWDNILSVKSKMLSGSGSMGMKLIAAQRTVELAGMVAANPGQETAIRQAIAAVQGASNVEAFRPRRQQVFKDVQIIIAEENSAMSIPNANPENFMVRPDDPHLDHLMGHYSDAMFDMNTLAQMDQGGANPEEMMEIIKRLGNKGGHMYAHLNFVSQDPSKKEQAMSIAQNLENLQRMIDEIAKKVQKALQEKAAAEGQTEGVDPKIQSEVAKSQIEIATKQKLADIKISERAASHELKKGIDQEKAANQMGIQRAKAAQEIRLKQAKELEVEKEPVEVE